ncbi:putative retinoblastoma-binding protein 5/Swd1 [Plasmopara halstedii]
MWSHVLRRIVRNEEQQQAERRRQQLAQASSSLPSASVAASTSSEVVKSDSQADSTGKTVVASESASIPSSAEAESTIDTSIEEDTQDDDDYLQKHLLSRPTSSWSCLEDTQQANCLALNASHTLLAVGERDGRMTIWDNTSIRVITRELDPTLIAVEFPTGETDANQDGTLAKSTITGGDGSVANDDASVEDEDEQTEDAVSIEDEMEAEDDINESDSKPEGEAESARGGSLLTLSDLHVAKTGLKVVSQCTWSCDSQYLFAGCEEKASRRARLCIWNVEAATLISAFQFDGTITALSAHPRDPKILLVSLCNSCPVILNIVTGDTTELMNVPLENTEVAQPTSQSNSRHSILASCARYGQSGTRIYCATTRSTLAILDSKTLQCLDSLKLNVLIQFVDLCVNWQENAMLLTSSKGIHEFMMKCPTKDDIAVTEDHPLGLKEVALHSTGAVRAPWAVCCFSGNEEFVVGTPVVRHRHVGENGLFTWPRASDQTKTTAQHNVGVKDGVLALAWDRCRQSVLAVSTSGALHVLEEPFSTTWPGAMYPAGFRLITDNELHLQVFESDAEERKLEKKQLTEKAKNCVVDVFRVQDPRVEFAEEVGAETDLFKGEERKLCFIPAIPIAHFHRRQGHQLHGVPYNEDKHFGLGQSVFEPLKGSLGKPKQCSTRRFTSNKKKRRRK